MEMENEPNSPNSDSVDLSYQDMESILLCPVCQDRATSPIYQCPNGHLICSTCIEQLTDSLCPCCRTQLPKTKIRSRAVEQLVQNMRIDCKNKDKGCGAKVKVSEHTDHLSSCLYEGINYCAQLQATCEDRILAKEFKSHIFESHNNSRFTKEGGIGVIFQEIRKADLENQADIRYEPVYLFDPDSDTIFAILGKYNDKTFKWQCVQCPSDKETASTGSVANGTQPKPEFLIHFILDNEEKNTKLMWTGPVQPMSSFIHSKSTDTNSFCVRANSLLGSFCKSESAEDESYHWTLKVDIFPFADFYSNSAISSSNWFQNCMDIGAEVSSGVLIHYNKNSGTEGHFGCKCDSCGVQPVGNRYKCGECEDFDLCETCERAGVHNHHVFLRIASPSLRDRMVELFFKCQTD